MTTTLYKKNTKGKLLIWEIDHKKSYSNIELVIKTGEYYGNKVLHYKPVKAKNIGKANETSIPQQAELMTKALILGQRKYGYKSLKDLKISDEILVNGDETDFINEILRLLPNDATDLNDMLKPMLASGYFRTKKDWVDPYGKTWKDRKYFYLQNPHEPKEKGAVVAKFPMGGQAKINGVRCSVYLEDEEVKMKSKEGEEYVVSHIIDWFSERLHLFADANGKAIVYDGELYIHGEKLQHIRSAVVKPNLNTPSVTYEIYDIAVPIYTNKTRIQQLKVLLEEAITAEITGTYCPIRYVKTYLIRNDKEAQSKCDDLISQGYEGIILRNLNAPYQFGKRTVNMLKLKRLMHEEFEITGISLQENDNELGLYNCITKEGVEFKVTPTEDEDYKRLIVIMPHLVVNKLLTCAFYEYTDNSIPFHIVHNIVRDYEDNTTNKCF